MLAAMSSLQQRPINGWAIAGFVTSIVALLSLLFQLFPVTLILGLAAFAMGIDGINKARKGSGGLGLAVAALSISVLPLASGVFTFIRIFGDR